MSAALQAAFVIGYWLLLLWAAVLVGSALLWLYATVDGWRMDRLRARRDREERARMESLRRMADWEWAMEPFRWEWAQADWRRYVRALPDVEREVAR